MSATVECGPCAIPFATVADPAEAAFLAAVHNGLEHGGGQVAAAAELAAEWADSMTAATATAEATAEDTSNDEDGL